jgi:hypothetical protein
MLPECSLNVPSAVTNAVSGAVKSLGTAMTTKKAGIQWEGQRGGERGEEGVEEGDAEYDAGIQMAERRSVSEYDEVRQEWPQQAAISRYQEFPLWLRNLNVMRFFFFKNDVVVGFRRRSTSRSTHRGKR